MFAKKDNKDRNVSASTHLICPQADGQKYKAAVKWGLPVVDKVGILNLCKDMLSSIYSLLVQSVGTDGTQR